MIEKSQDEKRIKLNKVNKLDKELSNLERKMAELRWQLEVVQMTRLITMRCNAIRSQPNSFEADLLFFFLLILMFSVVIVVLGFVVL